VVANLEGVYGNKILFIFGQQVDGNRYYASNPGIGDMAMGVSIAVMSRFQKTLMLPKYADFDINVSVHRCTVQLRHGTQNRLVLMSGSCKAVLCY